MKEGLKVGLIVVGVIAAFTALGWFAAGNELAMKKVFLPANEQVRRETYEQSKAYQEGVVQELQNMQFEYLKATPEQQAGLRTIILHRAADFPEDQLPHDLKMFLQELKK